MSQQKTRIIGRYDEHLVVGLDCSKDVKITKDSFKDECDINVIMVRYARTGVLPENYRQPQYADVSEIPSYMEALEVVRQAEDAFYALPAQARLECANDPAVFIDRLRSDEAWARKHGLLAESEAEAAPLASPAARAAEAPVAGAKDSGKTQG
jgi:phage internal scaffolding protein